MVECHTSWNAGMSHVPLQPGNKQLHYFWFAFLSNKKFEAGTNGMEIPRASFRKIWKLLNFLKENHSAICKKKSQNFGVSRKAVLFSWNFLISCCTRHLRFSKVHIEIFSSHGKCPLVWKFSVTTGTVFPRIFEKGDNLKEISEMSYPEFLFHVIFLLNLRNFRLNSSVFGNRSIFWKISLEINSVPCVHLVVIFKSRK